MLISRAAFQFHGSNSVSRLFGVSAILARTSASHAWASIRSCSSCRVAGQGGQAEVDPLTGETFGLAIKRLMLSELFKKDHRQQTGTGETARNDMEGCGRLVDRFALPAREFFPHREDHLPLPRRHLQGLGDGLAQFAQLARTAARAGRRRAAQSSLL